MIVIVFMLSFLNRLSCPCPVVGAHFRARPRGPLQKMPTSGLFANLMIFLNFTDFWPHPTPEILKTCENRMNHAIFAWILAILVWNRVIFLDSFRSISWHFYARNEHDWHVCVSNASELLEYDPEGLPFTHVPQPLKTGNMRKSHDSCDFRMFSVFTGEECVPIEVH